MKIELIRNSCPLCGSDVKGNDEHKFFCSKCNLLFSRNHLIKKDKTKKKSFEEPLPIHKEPIHLEEPKIIIENTSPLEEPKDSSKEIQFVASVKSNKMHIDSCRFLKNIQKENCIHLDSLEAGLKKGYKPCICIRRKGIMKL